MTPTRLLASALACALLAVACNAAGTPPGTTVPGPSSSASGAACATTPEPAQDALEGWSAAEQQPTVFPQVINPSGSLACGPNRLLFSFLDGSNVPVAGPDRTASVALYDLGADPETPVTTAEGRFIWAIEDTVGVYAADVELPTAGLWGAEFTTAAPGGEPEVIRMQIDVAPESSVVGVGDEAPPTATPTLTSVGGDVSKISTDEDPVVRFYETSIADAVAAGEPFVVAFATPKFCATAQCGPTLDRIKPVASAHPEMTFINVEPYELKDVEGQLQPVLDANEQLTPAPASRDWRLLAEPWVFVVDGEGIVRSSLLLIFSEEELEAAIAEVGGS